MKSVKIMGAAASSQAMHTSAGITSTTTTATAVTVNLTPPREAPPDYRRMDSRSYRYFRRIQPAVFCLAIVVTLLGYAFIGAAVFVSLEAETEKENFRTLMDARNDFLALVNLSIELAAGEQTNGTGVSSTLTSVNYTQIYVGLRSYELTLRKYRNIDLDGDLMWNYFGALFFSATVISTIGYGNIAPVTTGGRVFCIIYAVFGIAMLLLVLASIGSLFARGATMTYRLLHLNIQMAKGLAPPPKKTKKLRPVRVPAPGEQVEGAEGQGMPLQNQEDKRPDMDDVIRDIWSNDPEVPQGDIPPQMVMSLKEPRGDEGGPTKKDTETGADEEATNEEEQVDIPLSIVLVFALMYVCVLAGLLILWEGQWNYFEAFYFSFITLTTIGFGDLTPVHQKNLLGCTFFILLGMAIMSMCIALAQEIIMKKVAWISQRVGVALIKAKPAS